MLIATRPHFAIVGYDNKESTYAKIGTGFFVNDSGAFVTAAHTFRDTKRKYFAVLDNEFYLLPEPKLILTEVMENQVPPLHKDLYIGKFDELKSAFYKLKSVSALKKDDELTFNGFASTIYEDGVIITRHTIDEILSNARLNAKGFVKDYELKRIHESTLSGKFVRSGFNKLTFLSPSGEMSNGLSFVLTSNIELQELIRRNPIMNRGQDPAGFSGGPVIFDGNAIGMLITQDAGISSDYLAEKLDELQIEYNLSA